MVIPRQAVVVLLLLTGQIPMGKQPIGISCGQKKFLRPVGIRQTAALFGRLPRTRRGSGADGVTLTGAGGLGGGRGIAFEENGGESNVGLGAFAFAGRLRALARGLRFFL